MHQPSVAEIPFAGAREQRLLARMHVRADLLAFAAATAVILGFYALLHAAVLDPVSYLDPWIYTALFTNFGYLYHAFTWAYWTSRLPWIIPGIAVNWVLPPVGAFFVLHIVFFSAGGLSAYLLARRFFGSRVALVGAAALMLLPLYFDAHSNDYPDGPTITYVLAAACFGIGVSGSRGRALRLGAAGFFVAAAFGTQIFAAVAIVGVILVYLVVESAEPGFPRRLARVDLPAAAMGALVLLVACGSVARAYGGEFLFFMPSWRYAQSIQLSRWQRPGHEWILQESQLLIPLFVLALLVALLVRRGLHGWRSDPSLRFAVGSALFLGYMTAFLSIWELAFGGDFFEVYYYFSMFLVPVALAFPACLYLLVRNRGLALPLLAVPAAVAAAALPVLLVYRLHTGPVNRGGFYFSAALMSAVLALALLRDGRPALQAALVTGAVLLLAFTTGYAGASGYTTTAVFSTSKTDFTHRRAALAMAMQLIGFMRANGLQTEPPPAFWYDGYKYPALNGIQSTYLWGITWIGREMPHVGRGVQKALRERRPPDVVLLCGSYECSGGPQALENAGYRLVPRASTTLHSHGERFWVRAYEIPKFKPLDPVDEWYRKGQSPFAPAVTGRQLSGWSFSGALPDGWSTNAPITSVGGVPTLQTSSRPWNYEVLSPKTALAPGSYSVYLRGRVLAGGLDLGVLDVGANRWIAQRTYSSRQNGFGTGWMVTPFQVSQPTTVQFILSNWVPKPASSRWQLRELRLVRTG